MKSAVIEIAYTKRIEEGMEMPIWIGYEVEPDGVGKAIVKKIYERVDGDRVVVEVHSKENENFSYGDWDMSLKEFAESIGCLAKFTL